MRGSKLIPLQVPTGGLVANVPIQQVPPNATAGGSNVFVDLDGLFKPRLGYTAINTLAVAEQMMFGGYVSYLDYSGTYQTVVAGFTSWQLLSANTFTNITDGANPNTGGADNFNHFAVFPGQFVWIYGVNGKDPIRAWHVGLANYTTINGANAPSTAKDLTVLGGRLVTVNTTESGTNFFYRIRWSAINDGTTWPALGFLDLLDTAEQITCIQLTSQLSAVVYTATSAYYLYAVPGNDASCFATEKITATDAISGPSSPSAIAQAEGQHYYFAGDGRIWNFNGQSLQPISAPIDAVLKPMVDFQVIDRSHAVYLELYRQVWFFFAAVGDNGVPMHAVMWDLRLQCFSPIMTFKEGITSSAPVILNNSPQWTNWVSLTDTWLTIPYASWQSIPVENSQAVLIGTTNNVYVFFTGNSDNGTAIPYSWLGPLLTLDPTQPAQSLNITDFEIYLQPSGVNEIVTVQLNGLLEPYSIPSLIFSYSMQANSVPTTVTLSTGSQAAGAPEAQKFPWLQVFISSSGVVGGGMRFAGGTLWTNAIVRGTYTGTGAQ